MDIKQLLKKVTIEEKSFNQKKLDGLKRRRPKKVDYVLQIENLWERHAFERSEQSLERILKQLRFTIQQKAKYYGRKWNNSKISAADFESKFWEEAWKLCEEGYEWNTDFYFYETLLLAIDRRATDVTRSFTQTQQGNFETKVLSLKEEAADFISSDVNIESEVINKEIVMQLIDNTQLTAQERSLLKYKYENTYAGYSEIAKALQLDHHEQVRRLFKRIRKKLMQYA